MSKKIQIQKTSPTLKTIIMVEDTIQKLDGSIVTIAEIKKALPKQINHNTLITILEYLEKSFKIYVGVRGITWIENNDPRMREAIRKGTKH
jgi:exosome complex RNA-binding protein Rrp4